MFPCACRKKITVYLFKIFIIENEKKILKYVNCDINKLGRKNDAFGCKRIPSLGSIFNYNYCDVKRLDVKEENVANIVIAEGARDNIFSSENLFYLMMSNNVPSGG